jgi:hypothetical protein
MIYKRNRVHSRGVGGFFNFEEELTKTRVHGFGYEDYIRLRDDCGQTWRGTAEEAADGSFRYTFRNSNGKVISGMADGLGIILRDEKGRAWRGFID